MLWCETSSVDLRWHPTQPLPAFPPTDDSGAILPAPSPGFPDSGTGACPQFVVNESFSDVAWAHQHFYEGPGLFVNAAAGNYSLLPDSPVYADMPAFVRVPFCEIGKSPATTMPEAQAGGVGGVGKP